MLNYYTQFSQNWQSLLTMNISRSTEIQYVYCVPWTPSPLYIVVGLAPRQLYLTYRTQQCRLTERASNDQHLGNLDDTVFVAKLYRVRLLGGKFSCFHELQCTGKQVTSVRWIVVLSIASFYCTCAKISNCGKLKALFLLQIKYYTFWCMDHSALMKSSTLENTWNGRNMWTVNNG